MPRLWLQKNEKGPPQRAGLFLGYAIRSIRDIARDSFDIKAHAQKVAIRGHGPICQPDRAVLLVDRAGERVISARCDSITHRFGFGLYICGDGCGDFTDLDLAPGDAFPRVDLRIGTVHQGTNPLDIVGRPVVDN